MYPLDWLEERSGIVGGIKYFLFRKVPGDSSWWHTLGSATLTAFLVQLVTGVILAMYYKPSPAEAHSSIEHIQHDLWGGWLVRGMHRWGASVFIILMFMHMGRVFLFGAYKYPRELNWIVGVLILATGLFEGLTGYLLPFDQTAYWATVVAVNINGTAPFVGPYLATVLRGGAEIGPDTLARFYSIHMLLVPGALIGLIGLHLYLVVRLGITSPPWSKEAAGGRARRRAAARALRPRPARPAGRGRPQEADRMSSLDERRAGFKRYKEDVKKRGKPFYPFAMFEDTVMSLVVVIVIAGLAVVWKNYDILGPLIGPKADPGTISFVPRPDWYFYFLFYLLRIFKWPETVILATIGIPTLCLVLLLALPFVDLRTERRLSRRPVAVVAAALVILSMGVLTYKGAVAKEPIASEVEAAIPSWAQKQGFAGNQEALAGAKLFAESGCTNCHTYLGSGGSNLGAPDLSAEGAKGKGIQFQIDHLKCPSCVNPGSPMPPFAELGEDNLHKLAVFLEASKGPK